MGVECPKCKTENTSDSEFCKKCATPLPSSKEIPVTETLETPTEELTRGTTFANRYEIIEELGKGGMGKVYRVEDKKIKEEVALKLIKPEIASDKKTIERFSNELKMARKIAHRNVGRMYHLSDHEGTHYITMEYVPGQDLKGLIRQSGQLAIGTTIKIAKQVSEGLAEAHRLGVIHRDMKPSNVMMDKEGNARVMDFGIARSLKSKGLTGAGVMVGTPEYMSPEQTEAKEVDRQSDIYSLGVILYEMVTGQLPFEGDTPLSIAMKHKGEMPKDPREFNPQIPEDLSLLILKCLEKRKEDRYPGAEHVYSELSKIEQRIPTRERIKPKKKPITSKEITVTFGVKKLFIPALVFIAVVVIGLILLQVLPKKNAAPLTPSGKPSLAVMYFENRSDEPELDEILVDMLTTNLSRYEEIEVVSSQRLFDILKQLGKQDAEKIDKNMATEVANRAGVKTMMMGSIIKIGDNIRITSQLLDVQTGAIIGSEQIEGNKIEDIFDMADQLTEKISFGLGVSTEEIGEPFRIAEVTTSFFEAYKYYRRGLEDIWKWNPWEAVKKFEKAVEIDSTFAMAHLYLAVARERSGYFIGNPFADPTPIRESIQLAKKHASKATDKERHFIDTYEAYYSRRYETAERLAVDLVKRYPDDKEAAYLLSQTSWYARNFDQSIQALERTLEIDPTYANIYNSLAYAYSRIQDHQKAISTIKKYIALQPDLWNPYDSAAEIYMRAGLYTDVSQICEAALKINPEWYYFYVYHAFSYLFMGDEEKAHDKLRQLRRLQPDEEPWHTLEIGYLFLYKAKYNKVLSEFQNAVKIAQREQAVRGEVDARCDLGKMFAELGEYAKALAEFSKVEEISSQKFKPTFNPYLIIVNYIRGITMVKKRDYPGAQICAANIEELIQSENYDDLHKDFYYLLLGELFVSQGNGLAARDALGKVSWAAEQYSPRYYKLNAACHALMGASKKAIATYSNFYNAFDAYEYPMGDCFYYILERSKFNFYLARFYEQDGDTAKAIEHYEKFLDLWKDADPSIAEVEDARERLAGLKSK